MKLDITPYDTADYLDNEETILGFLEEIAKENDPALMAYALGAVARARGMSEIAEKTGMSRESLYKALSGEGNPAYATIHKVANAVGFRLNLVPALPTRTVKKPAPHRKTSTVKAKAKTKPKTKRKVA